MKNKISISYIHMTQVISGIVEVHHDPNIIRIFPDITHFTPNFYYDIHEINEDDYVKKRLTTYYYRKIVDKWLFNQYQDFAEYFQMKNGKFGFIDDLKDKKKTLDAVHTSYALQVVKNFIITKEFVRKSLAKYVKLTRANWYDLYYHSSEIKHLIKHRIKKHLEKFITGVGKFKLS